MGLDSRQQEMLRKMPGLMAQLLKKSQSDRDQILTKLEEILKIQSKLELRMVDRHVTLQQRTQITNSLCKFGRRNINIGLYNADGEMQTLAKELSDALPMQCDGKLGWAVSIMPMQVTEGFSGIQIVVEATATSEDRLFANAVVDVLREVGLQVEGPMPPPQRGTRLGGGGRTRQFIESLGIPAASVEIAIGKKP